jgi:hypothetical protein
LPAFCGCRLLPSNIRLFLLVHPCEGLGPVSAFFYYGEGGGGSIFRIYRLCLLPAFTRTSSRYFVAFWHFLLA